MYIINVFSCQLLTCNVILNRPFFLMETQCDGEMLGSTKVAKESCETSKWISIQLPSLVLNDNSDSSRSPILCSFTLKLYTLVW